MDVKWIPSPNKTVGRRGFHPEAVVIHIMEGTLRGTDAWFRNRESQVSAHYGVGRDGEVHQYVREADAAWHAGRRSKDAPWRLLRRGVNPNHYTIGIEHEGKADDDWPEAMYAASAALVHEICLRWSIPIDRDHIIGHREIYTVKTCPGSQVNLARLVRDAGASAQSAERHNFVAQKGRVELRATVNLRKAPTTGAAKTGTARAGTGRATVGWTSSGEAVHGNPHWYKDARGTYFWAGATHAPIPGIS